MVGIFAIIATFGQEIFAIVAIYLFAKIANTSDMSNLDHENKKWLAGHLANLAHGEKGKVAAEAGTDSTKLSRMANVDLQSSPKNTMKIPLDVLKRLAAIFKDLPPGLKGTAEVPSPVIEAGGSSKLVRVPVLGNIPAGRLREALSQISSEDSHLVFDDLGNGEFFALTVEGDSMDKLVPDGAKIVVNTLDTELVSGKPYVFAGRGGYSLKLWKPNPPRWAPYSTNPDNEPTYVKNKETAKKMVVGRATRAVLDFK